MSPKLWEIGEKLEALLLESVDVETGEIKEEALEELERAEMEFAEKALAVAKFVQGQRLEASGVRQVGLELLGRADRLDAHADRLVAGYLQPRLETHGFWLKEPGKTGKEVLLSDYGTEICVQKSVAAVEGENPVEAERLPEEFRRIVPARVVAAKDVIRVALNKGETVPGWRLERRCKLVIKP